MQHINSASDLEPKSIGFANRGAESINIIGNVLSDILNGFGNALSGIAKTGLSSIGEPIRILQTSNEFVHFPKGTAPNPNDPDPREAIADAIRVQHEIDKNVPSI